jgi:hypothetical protein
VNVVASGDEVDIGFMIALERPGVAMEAPTVGFDNHSLSRPEEVDQVARDQDIDRRLRHLRSAPES